MNGNKISAFTPTLFDSNADNAPPGKNNKNNVMCVPRFIGHQNGIVFRVFTQKRISTDVFADKRRKYRIVPSSMLMKKSLGTVSSNPQFDISAVLVTKKPLVIEKRLSFISHPNGI